MFLDTTRKGALPKETYMHTPEITVIKNSPEGNLQKVGQSVCYMYSLIELHANY